MMTDAEMIDSPDAGQQLARLRAIMHRLRGRTALRTQQRCYRWCRPHREVFLDDDDRSLRAQEVPEIERILTYLGLQARAPPRPPARGQALQAA